jgi:hypothetical protein
MEFGDEHNNPHSTQPQRKRRAEENLSPKAEKTRRENALPDGAVVILTVNRIERFLNRYRDDTEECDDLYTEVFKIPTARLHPEEVAFLETHNLRQAEAYPDKAWISLQRRLGIYKKPERDEDDENSESEKSEEEEQEERAPLFGGCLRSCVWNETKGPVIVPGDVVTHVFFIEA